MQIVTAACAGVCELTLSYYHISVCVCVCVYLCLCEMAEGPNPQYFQNTLYSKDESLLDVNCVPTSPMSTLRAAPVAVAKLMKVCSPTAMREIIKTSVSRNLAMGFISHHVHRKTEK